MAPTPEQIRDWQHKADQYDTIVADLKVADGGRYRADTLAAILARLKRLEQDIAAAVAAERARCAGLADERAAEEEQRARSAETHAYGKAVAMDIAAAIRAEVT